jgi:tetratricopeptide (TPR) repeat protein
MFTVQDSYRGPDKLISYDNLQTYWRHFNYLFLVIYPPGRETEVLTLLGPYVDETYAQQYAAQKASNEIFSSTGRPQFFAWFNRATNLMLLQDYGGAAAAYDEAFQVYNDLDPEIRPWRIIWYQTGPYWAYFYTGRYYDVINLATLTLENMSEKVLEESYYWRALAKEALGDIDGAINDLRTSVSVHPDWEPGLIHLERLGAVP